MQRVLASIVLVALIAFAVVVSNAATVPTPNPTSHGLAADAGMAAFVIAPSDTDVFQSPVRVWVGGAGTLAVVPANGTATVSLTVAANTYVPLYVTAVKATGTAATLLVAIY